MYSVEISNGALIKCSHESCGKVVNKCNLQSKTPSISTPSGDSVIYICTYYRVCTKSMYVMGDVRDLRM
jgi:hypothetical protein